MAKKIGLSLFCILALGPTSLAFGANDVGAAPVISPSKFVLPDAASLSAEIAAKGPKAVVDRLYVSRGGKNGASDWDRLMDMVENGRAAYVALVPALAPGADGAPAEELGISLALALTHAPSTVLRILDRQNGRLTNGADLYGVGRVCSAPFIEPTDRFMTAYFRSARAALAKVTAPDLKAAKTACLTQLESSAKTTAPLKTAPTR